EKGNFKLQTINCVIDIRFGQSLSVGNASASSEAKPLSAGSSAGTGTAHCSSHRKPLRLLVPPKSLVAFPAGQGRLRQHCIARRKLGFIFEESTVLRSNQPSKK